MKSADPWFRFLDLDDTGSKSLHGIVSGVSEWCKALQGGQEPRWLSLLGVSGVGKTHCAARVWKWIQGSGRADSEFCMCSPFLLRWPVFSNDLREGRVWDVYRDAMRWPVLVVDDLGAGADPSGWVTSKIVDLLLARDGKWTLITSNLSFDQILAMDERIADRMKRHGGIVRMVAKAEPYTDWKRRANQ